MDDEAHLEELHSWDGEDISSIRIIGGRDSTVDGMRFTNVMPNMQAMNPRLLLGVQISLSGSDFLNVVVSS